MTMLKPTLALKRLGVYKDSRLVFDASFHNGLNIIRGHNSSGKTTILDFVAYTLGAESIPWKPAALLCDWSVAEVLLNGHSVTLRRQVDEKLMNPLYIFYGDFESAMKAPVTEWEVFGFRRSATKLSFTQTLLLGLELPDAQGDGASNLTMHQLLRVLYADQPSLHSPIFRTDTFDSALTRETVGGYLSGVYDDQLYVAQLEKRTLEKDVSQLEAELKSIFKVLAKSQQNANFEFLGQEIRHLESQREEKMAALSTLRQERRVEVDVKKTSPEKGLRAELDSAKKSLLTAEDEVARLSLDIADSQKFIEELELRLKALDESRVTRDFFGNLNFNFCPCCLSDLKEQATPENHCSLCKSPINAVAADAQVLRMRNELRIQLTESQAIMRDNNSLLISTKATVPSLRAQLKALERRYAESTQSWSSTLETAIENAAREIGALDQEIKGLYEHQQLAEAIRQLQEKKEDLIGRIAELDSKIESLFYAQEVRKMQVQAEVASTLKRLLRSDLNRTEEFRHAENIQFSFTDNVVSVNGATKFSESSTVVLRHLFHVALLSASTRIPEMRLPRFLILDGIEDGGMELPRSHRLQQIIASECATFGCDFQLIFATSQIAPSLNDDSYVVAQQFSEDSRSLQIGQAVP